MNPNPELEALDEELVAYLDGELDEAAARRVEERLASDERVRNRLRSLAGSWDLLDELPRAAVSDSFSKSTVQMVTLAVAQELTQQQAALPMRRRRRWLYMTIAALAAGMLGFVAFVMTWPDPNAALLRDLPLVENLERYRIGGDVEFLRELDRARLFTEEGSDTPWAAATSPTQAVDRDLLAARRARIEAMSVSEKSELRQRFERFQLLSAAEQLRLRQFDEMLSADDEQAKLRRVLQQYHDWLSTLSPLERADLLEMQADARLVRIRQLKQQELSRLAGQMASSPLAPHDVQAIFSWWEGVVVRRKDEIVAKASDRQRRWIENMPEDEQPRALVMLSMRLRGGPPRPPDVADEDWSSLEQTLSKDVVGRLSALPNPKDRQQLLHSMLIASMRAHDTVRGQVSQEELMRFYREDLAAEDRNRVAILPPDEFLSQLRRLYFQRRGSWGGGRDGGGPLRDGPPRETRPRDEG